MWIVWLNLVGDLVNMNPNPNSGGKKFFPAKVCIRTWKEVLEPSKFGEA